MKRIPFCKYVAETLNRMSSTGAYYTYQRVATLVDRAVAADPYAARAYYRLHYTHLADDDPDDGMKCHDQGRLLKDIAQGILDVQNSVGRH